MISWIQKTFQQHFRTVFFVLLVLVIVAFVFTIGASPGIGNDRNHAMTRPFFDLNLGSQEDTNRLLGDANLSVQLRAGYSALNEGQLQQYAFQRYAGLHIANTLHVPPPTSSEFSDFLKTMGAFAGQDQQFDPKRYAIFRDNLRTGRSLSEADVSRVVADDYRVDRVQKLLAGPGYVLSSDVKQALEQNDTKWTLALATVDYTAFAPKIEPSETDLAKFFEENGFRYEIPRQVRARAVEFPASAYLDKVTVSEADVRAFFDSNPARFPKPAAAAAADGKPSVQLPTATTGTDADFAAVRPQVETALKLERARTLATKAASDLTLALYEGKITRATADGFLSARNLTAKTLPPFSRDTAPGELGGSPEISREAFKLSDERFFSDALSTPLGSVVILWEETLAPRQPLIAEVRAKVLSDYIDNEKRKRFVEAGRTVRAAIESKLKSGEPFDKAAAASAGALKLETKTLPAFTPRDRPQDLDYSVLGALETLQKGAVTDMIISGNQGFIVHAVDKQAPLLDETNPRFVETRSQLAQAIGGRNANDYLRTLVEKELEKSNPVTR